MGWVLSVLFKYTLSIPDFIHWTVIKVPYWMMVLLTCYKYIFDFIYPETKQYTWVLHASLISIREGDIFNYFGTDE